VKNCPEKKKQEKNQNFEVPFLWVASFKILSNQNVASTEFLTHPVSNQEKKQNKKQNKKQILEKRFIVEAQLRVRVRIRANSPWLSSIEVRELYLSLVACS
jgi:hypothetical protein